MNVTIFNGINAAGDARGLCLVVDVFRATSTLAALLAGGCGAVRIVPDSIALAQYQGQENHLLFTDLKGFSESIDNSPITALRTDLRKRIAVIATMNGTKVLAAVKHCDQVVAASFINFDAVVSYVRTLAPAEVSIIACGRIDVDEPTIEDSLCAETYARALTAREMNESNVRQVLRRALADRERQSNESIGPTLRADLAFCCALGVLDIVPLVHYENGGMVAHSLLTQNTQPITPNAYSSSEAASK